MDPAGLKEAKSAIRAWIRQFSDQRLAEVYAFNADGKMRYDHACCCILGVTLARNLHVNAKGTCPESERFHCRHYGAAIKIPGSDEAEWAYCFLGIHGLLPGRSLGRMRRHRLSAILRAEMRRRERQQTVNDTTAPLSHAVPVSV